MHLHRIVRTTLKLAAIGAAAGGVFAGALPAAHAAGATPAAGKPAAAKTGQKKPQDPLRVLFLMPGGRYTKADIKANGNKTVSEKYPGFMAAHDAKPRPGDRVCPITDTKANPKLTWVVGGRTYQFCCPPCVVEFVRKAKTDPKSIKAPDAYVKR